MVQGVQQSQSQGRGYELKIAELKDENRKLKQFITAQSEEQNNICEEQFLKFKKECEQNHCDREQANSKIRKIIEKTQSVKLDATLTIEKIAFGVF